MAARADAVASLSSDRTVFSCFLSCKSQCFCTSSSRLPVFKRAYSREFLLDVSRITFLELNSVHAEGCGTSVCSEGLHHHRPPLLHLAHRRYKRRERKHLSTEEYTAILLVAVYIPPSSNNNNRSEALNYLYQHISEQQTAHPDAFLILAGDFNHADLKSVFPKYTNT